jgi:DNA polymerase V
MTTPSSNTFVATAIAPRAPIVSTSLYLPPSHINRASGQTRLPTFTTPVQAGFPSPATDYLEDSIDLNDYLIRHKAATFLFRVKGNSMLGAGIVDGDRVIVDRSLKPLHRHIVIAIVNDEYTIKRLFNRAGRIELHPENAEYSPICFSLGQELQVWGVVVGLARRYVY